MPIRRRSSLGEIRDPLYYGDPFDESGSTESPGPAPDIGPKTTVHGSLHLISSKSVFVAPADATGLVDITPPQEADVVEFIFGEADPAPAEPAQYHYLIKYGKPSQPSGVIFAVHVNGSPGPMNPVRMSSALLRGGAHLNMNGAGVGGSCIVNYYSYIL